MGQYPKRDGDWMISGIEKTGFIVLAHREYRFFWLAAIFSNVGMWALVYGRLWLMHSLTDSPLWVGLTTTASLGPLLLLSPFGGVVADRINRLRFLRITRAVFAVLAIVTGVLIATDVLEPWHLLSISLVTGGLLAFDSPSRGAMLPALVPQHHLSSAIALYSMIFGGASILGPAAFAPLVEVWGLEGVFFVIGGLYWMTVATLCFMKTDIHKPRTPSTSIFQGLVDGLKYVRRNQPVFAVILMGIFMGVFGSSFEALLPIFSDSIVSGGIGIYSQLLLLEGVGGLLAMLGVAILGLKIHPGRFYVVAGISFAFSLIALSRIDWLVGALVVIGIIGSCRVVFQTMGITLIQTLTVDEFRGRVLSLDQLTWGSAALGGLIMGGIGQYVSVRFAMGFGGIVLASAIVLLTSVFLKNFMGAQAPREVEDGDS